MKKLFQISFLLILSSCSFNSQKGEEVDKINYSNLASCYDYFRDCPKKTSLKNCSMQFGDFLVEECELSILGLKDQIGMNYLPKGAFQVIEGQDSALVFIYGVATSNDSLLNEIRVRTLKTGHLVNDSILLKPESSMKLDYLHFPPNELRISRTIPDGRQNIGLIRFNGDGAIHYHSPMSDTTFAMLSEGYKPGQKKVRIFNQFTDKLFIRANGLSAAIEGTVIKNIGGKGVRTSIPVELDKNPLFEEKYALIGVDIYNYCSLPVLQTTFSLTNSDKTKVAEGPFGSRITKLVGSIKPIKGYVYLE